MCASFESLFTTSDYLAERDQLPILKNLIDRYARESTFQGLSVVFGHLLVLNSLTLLEALWVGGASLTIAETHLSRPTRPIIKRLNEHGIPVIPLEDAVGMGDWFLDVGAILGKMRTPKGAAEATRTGVLHYRDIPCPVVSADDSRSKLIEGFFGTGDSFIRAWTQLQPNDALDGKRCVQFGYGKIGRGVARHAHRAGVELTVIEVSEAAMQRANAEGFVALPAAEIIEVQRALSEAELVIAVTGIPGVVGNNYPVDWFSVSNPLLVNLGAEDEFGPAFDQDRILGGRSIPLNFHLSQPTLNRYIDPALSAHILALESLIKKQGNYSIGIHPLPEDMDAWIIKTWRKSWPEEDLTGIGEDLGLV
jgi:adenosylhomocysteinase